jgi:hypothetical protein
VEEGTVVLHMNETHQFHPRSNKRPTNPWLTMRVSKKNIACREKRMVTRERRENFTQEKYPTILTLCGEIIS